MNLPNDMVERAARAQFDLLVSPALWPELTEESRETWRRTARVALEAALSGCPKTTVGADRSIYYGTVTTLPELIGKRVALVPLED